MALPNGALVILVPEWPYVEQDFETGKEYSSLARWFWINDASAPSQIVYGDGATKLSPNRIGKVGFAWIEVTETIERVGAQFLPEASQSDKVPDDADVLEFSNALGHAIPFDGSLFSGLRVTPIHGSDEVGAKKVEQLRSAYGWISVSGSCRIKPIPPAVPLAGLTTYTEGITLLLQGQTWSAEGGPRPGEPAVMYSVHKRVASEPGGGFSVDPYREPTLQMAHEIEWQGELCKGIEAPSGTTMEVIEFHDGKLVLLAPSDHIVVLKP